MKHFSEAFSRKLEGSNITRIQWISMYYINEYPDISQRELSKLMCVKDSSIGRLIDRLERDVIVKRIRSIKDRRVITLSLTKEGHEQFMTLLPVGQEFNDQLIKKISKKDLETFETVLKTMFLNVSE